MNVRAGTVFFFFALLACPYRRPHRKYDDTDLYPLTASSKKWNISSTTNLVAAQIILHLPSSTILSFPCDSITTY